MNAERLSDQHECAPIHVRYTPVSDEAAFEVSQLVDTAIREALIPSMTHPNAPDDWHAEFDNTNPFALLGATDDKDLGRFDPSNPNKVVLLGPTRDELGIHAETINLIALTLSSRVELRGVPLALLKQSLKRQPVEDWLFRLRKGFGKVLSRKS